MKTFPDEMMVISKLSPESKKKLRTELRKSGWTKNYPFLDMIFEVTDE